MSVQSQLPKPWGCFKSISQEAKNLSQRQTTPKLLGVVVFFITFLVLSTVTIHAISYGGVGGRPAYPREDNPRTESIFVHTVKPGEIIQEGVLVINNSSQEATIKVDGVDAVSSAGTAFACRQVGDPQKEVGTWIHLSKGVVTLAPQTNEIVPFTIQVPETAGVGEHNGCIVMEAIGQGQTTQGQSAISLSFRTGLRIALMVPGEIVRQLEIVDFKVSRTKTGDYLLNPEVKNLGNVSIDADIQVRTYYFFGRVLAENGGGFPILRDHSSDWNFELKRPFWGGWFKANLAVEYDANPEASVGIQSGKALTRLEGPSVWFFTRPKPLALAVEITCVLLFVSCLFLLFLCYKRKKWIKAKWVPYNIGAGEDIKSLAEKFDVSWKLLAKANKLKPPYTIKAGDKIRVPPKA